MALDGLVGLRIETKFTKGPSIKYMTLFLTKFDPLPCHTLSHIPGPPESTSHIPDLPLPFLVGLVQKSQKKAPCTNSLSIVRGDFFPGVLSGGLLSGRFCPFPLLSEYICYNRKLNITLNFMFHMYDKKFISVTSHALYPPSSCHKLSHLRPPSSVTYFMDSPYSDKPVF